jgi:hypothetical protein
MLPTVEHKYQQVRPRLRLLELPAHDNKTLGYLVVQDWW